MTQSNINFPETDGTHKVVHVVIDKIDHFNFSSYQGHARILTDILENNGYCTEQFGQLYLMSQDRAVLAGEQRKLYSLIEDPSLKGTTLASLEFGIPSLDGDGYQVIGMGHVDIDLSHKCAEFYGTSSSYGIGIGSSVPFLKEKNKEWNILLGR